MPTQAPPTPPAPETPTPLLVYFPTFDGMLAAFATLARAIGADSFDYLEEITAPDQDDGPTPPLPFSICRATFPNEATKHQFNIAVDTLQATGEEDEPTFDYVEDLKEEDILDAARITAATT